MAKAKSETIPEPKESTKRYSIVKVRVPKLSWPPLPIKRITKVASIGGASFLALTLLLIAGATVASLYYKNKIVPGVRVAGVSVGGLTIAQAEAKIAAAYSTYQSQPVVLMTADRKWEISPDAISLSLDPALTAEQAFAIGHGQNEIENISIILKGVQRGLPMNPAINYDVRQLGTKLEEITGSIDSPAQSSRIDYVDNQFVVAPSLEGHVVDRVGLMKAIDEQLIATKRIDITIPIQVKQPALTAAKAQQLIPALSAYQEQPLTLTYEDKKSTLDIQTILSLITTDETATSASGFSLSRDKLNRFIEGFASTIDRPARDAMFQYNNGRVEAFAPSQEGLEVDRDTLAARLEQTLLGGGNSRVLEVPVKRTQAKVSTDSVNDLGIKELIAHGESNYRGSPTDRAFNIEVAVRKINGTLIAPGAEFSFNDAVGEVTVATGFRQALVILSGKTVLGDGGGVCQVSTTVFRAALNAGLPITQRTAHAYRVGYYENDVKSPGLDATIYQPGVDFRFKNDTGHYVLLQASNDAANTKVSIDLYGTSDGRVATLTKPIYLSTTPAPPDLHQDDPTLPKGTVKQAEHSIPGAKVVFDRTVTRNGETIIQESFVSNYRPWQAVYLHGTKEM